MTGCLQEKSIVCPRNNTTDLINARILLAVEGRRKIYLSNEEGIPQGGDTSEIELLYPMEYLNTMNFPGIPPHKIELKVGSPIMLLRNVNLLGGLCNGTRRIVRQVIVEEKPRNGGKGCALASLGSTIDVVFNISNQWIPDSLY
ncbi:DNA helicase [Tanacetum coccineum]